MQLTFTTLAISLLASISTAAPAPASLSAPAAKRCEYFDPLPNRCTIGLESSQGQIPGGSPGTGGGVNTVVGSMFSYIVGTDGCRTTFDVKSTGQGAGVTSDGNYGGIDGGDFHIEGYNSHASNMASVTITYKGQRFVSNEAPPGTCDCYSSSRPFSQTSGCRCRFDCK